MLLLNVREYCKELNIQLEKRKFSKKKLKNGRKSQYANKWPAAATVSNPVHVESNTCHKRS